MHIYINIQIYAHIHLKIYTHKRIHNPIPIIIYRMYTMFTEEVGLRFLSSLRLFFFIQSAI